MRDLKLPDQRHPEKAHRADAPVLRKPEWIRVKAPSSEGYRKTREIMRENRLEGTRIGRQRLHLSLHHVGDYARLPSRFTYAARLAGDSVAMPRFRIAFDRVGSFEAAPAVRETPGCRDSTSHSRTI